MKVEGEVEARWAFIGKWEIIPAINKHFQLILERKNGINYRQTMPSKLNVFSEIDYITEQATNVINLFIFVLKMFYACYFLFLLLYILYQYFVISIRHKN